jgi:hypothetical protein
VYVEKLGRSPSWFSIGASKGRVELQSSEISLLDSVDQQDAGTSSSSSARPLARRAARAPDAPKAPSGPDRTASLSWGCGTPTRIRARRHRTDHRGVVRRRPVFAIADGRQETAVGLTAGVIGGAILYRVGFRTATH